LGLSQINRLKDYVARRHQIADSYNKMLLDLPIGIPWQDPDSFSAFHLYIIQLKLDLISKSRGEIYEFLVKSGVGVNIHYIPVHLHPYYSNLGFKAGDFPVSEKYYSQAISLPIFPSLLTSEQEHVIKVIKKALL
jgi:dTDP-4-amino-4,6-dideoxygalactose transaminase